MYTNVLEKVVSEEEILYWAVRNGDLCKVGKW